MGSLYDILFEVIGVNGNGIESLMEYGVLYKDIVFKEGKIDIESVLDGVFECIKVIVI